MNEDCERMKDRMADHLFDRLDERDSEALSDHIAKCSKCAEHFRALQDQEGLLRELAEEVDAGMQRRKEAMAEAIKRYNARERARGLSPIARFAAAALVFIAVGFVAGRLLPGQPVDIERLSAALETSLKASLEEEIHDGLMEQVSRDRESALERYHVRLKDELARQFSHEMDDFAVRTLAASEASTERRLEQLIRLIEAARAVDHRQIAKALHYLESSRLEDRTRLGESLESLGEMLPANPTTN